MMYRVVLKKNEEKRLLGGHLWVYANEVSRIEGSGKQGSIAEVVSADGKTVGYGYINHASKILVRLLSENDPECGEELFRERMIAAKEYREQLGYGMSYRAIFGENDLLPGLIVDKYGDYLSVQLLTLGMDVRRDMIVSLLVEIFAPLGIYERSDVPVRQKEGLTEVKGLLYGDVPDKVTFSENGLKMTIDIKNGQKTGYFLDQKQNRAAVAGYARGRTVLDCFCNVGGFSLCAAKQDAKEVTAVDISESAIRSVRENAEVNGLTINTKVADVFETLREYRKENKKFGLVILDPPAFTKSKDTVRDAMRGYADINTLGLKLVEKGGFLATASCSQHFNERMFLNMIAESVHRSGVRAQIVEIRHQAADHPDLVGMEDEGAYLKMVILRVLS